MSLLVEEAGPAPLAALTGCQRPRAQHQHDGQEYGTDNQRRSRRRHDPHDQATRGFRRTVFVWLACSRTRDSLRSQRVESWAAGVGRRSTAWHPRRYCTCQTRRRRSRVDHSVTLALITGVPDRGSSLLRDQLAWRAWARIQTGAVDLVR